MTRAINLHHYLDEYPSHDYYYHQPGFGIWHIVGLILGLIILCALIGLVINCLRSNSSPYGHEAPGVTY